MSVKLGHFELIDQIGQGGMGTVFSAYDPTLNRNVAIKVLDEELAQDERLVQDFFREAQTAAAISHPHIVPIYFVGQEEGHNYIVMELLNGHPLNQILQQGQLTEAQTVRMAIEITEALKAAYTNKMIHGDIKPANIFMTNDHGAKLLDFGLAKLANVEVTNTEGGIWGSAYYISPERVGQKAEDFRSDIYSLGATMFEALTGRPPFDAPGIQELAAKRLHEKPPLLRVINPTISKRTERMVNKMLAKSAIMRFLDYDSLLAELRKAEAEAVNGAMPSQETTELFRTTNQIQPQQAAPKKSGSPMKMIAIGSGVLALLAVAAVPVILSHKNVDTTAQSKPAASTTIATESSTAPTTSAPVSTPTPAPVAAATPKRTPAGTITIPISGGSTAKTTPVSTTTVATNSTISTKPLDTSYGTKPRQFRYHNPDAKTVFIQGNINGWKPEEMKMDKNGFWFIDKVLPRNVPIEYQYIVDGEVIPDPWGAIPKMPGGPNGTMKSVYTIPLVDPTPKPVTATTDSTSSTPAPPMGAALPKISTLSTPAPMGVTPQPSSGEVDFAALANTPEEWPRAVTLKAPAKFAIMLNGQPAGEIQAPAGQHVTLKKVEATQVTVELQGALQTVPIASTDLAERVLTARAKPKTTAANVQ